MSMTSGDVESGGKQPTKPTIGTATWVSSTVASVAFTPSAYTGKGTISYTVTASSGQTGTGSSSPIEVSGLTAGSTVTFTVTAVSVTGVQSVASGISPSLVMGIAPSAPTIGTAVIVQNVDRNIDVAYTAGATGTSGSVTYTVTSSPGGITATGSSPVRVSGLTAGTAYTFTVTASTIYGSATSAASNSVTAGNRPPAPGTVTPENYNTNGTYMLSWNANYGTGGNTNYTATASTGQTRSTGTPSTSISFWDLSPLGTARTFTVTATNAYGTSPASAASASVANGLRPGSPSASWSDFSIAAGNAQVTVTFALVYPSGGTGAQTYTIRIYRASDSALISTSSGNTASPVTVTGLTNGTAYFAQGNAVNAYGESLTFQTPNATPVAPPYFPPYFPPFFPPGFK